MTPADLDAIVEMLDDGGTVCQCGADIARWECECGEMTCNDCGSPYAHGGPHYEHSRTELARFGKEHGRALAAALREAWAERDILNDARNVLTDAVATLTQERDEWKHVAEQRDVDGAALASRLRADKAEQRQRAERAEQERDAVRAAVDAVRADYAPRREPPTADEVRALAGLRGDGFDPQWIVRFDADTLVAMTVSVGLGSAGAIVCHDFAGTRRDPVEFATWEARGPSGPVAWSELAALVRGGDRG